MPRKPTTPLELLVENLQVLGVGEHKYKLDDGDRALEITVRVTRRSSWNDNKKHAADAIAFLSSQPWWTGRGDCGTFRARRGSCSRNFTHAIVSRGWDGKPSYSFVCRQHGEKAKLEQGVIAVVELPKFALDQAMKAARERAVARAREVCGCGHARQCHHMTGCDGGERGTPKCSCDESRFRLAAEGAAV